MSALVTLLAAVHSPPEEGRLVLCGTERVHTKGGFRNVAFYHVLTSDTPLSVTAGDIVHACADVFPDSKRHGRVTLKAREIERLGRTDQRDAQGGFRLPYGYTQFTVEGRVASDARAQRFPDGEMLVNFALHVQPGQGLLEGAVYGMSAAAAAELRKGERVRLQGRLLSQKRPDASGSMRLYTKLELPRLQNTSAKTRDGRIL